MVSALLWVAIRSGFGTPQSGTEQLIARAGQTGASVNGASVRFRNAPTQIQGHTMTPLSETLAFLGLSVTHGDNLDFVGGLSLTPALDQAKLNGNPIPVDGNLQKVGPDVFIRASLLADAIGARLTAGEHGEFYLTLVRASEGDATLPQPRFATDRDEYAIGEPVFVEEFSFDPLGQNVYLHWTNLQPAYFKAGRQTITLEADNREGRGNRLSRTITISEHVMNTPLQFTLKYGAVGDLVDDVSTTHPTLPRLEPEDAGPQLFVSDSPEDVARTGAVFRENFQGRARLVAYHINAGSNPAQLCVAVKNVDDKPATFRTMRIGDTAPAGIEGILGQVTLMSFLTGRGDSTLRLGPGETALAYVSPPLAPGTGASLLADLRCERRCEVTVAMTVGDSLLSPDSVAALDLLGTDGRHVRGVFPTSVRRFSLDLAGQLPAKAVIGDPEDDPSEVGEDPTTRSKVTLDGNYGVTYEITLRNARGVVAAIAPRGGLYKGAVVVEETGSVRRQLVRLPRQGVLSSPDRPMIFMRSEANTVRLEFIPASGSQLPVHLVFYRI